jgi:hypothetical protein
MLVEAGFAPDSIEIEPLGFGRLGSGFAVTEFVFPGPIRGPVKAGWLLLSLVRDRWQRNLEAAFDMPLGYHLFACKAGRS